MKKTKKPKKETFEVLRKIDGKDTVETVQGYTLGEHFGVYWFTHKENGNWRVSEVKSGMAATPCLYACDENGDLLTSAKGVTTIADVLLYAPRYLTYLYNRIGAENFFRGINKGRERMTSSKAESK